MLNTGYPLGELGKYLLKALASKLCPKVLREPLHCFYWYNSRKYEFEGGLMGYTVEELQLNYVKDPLSPFEAKVYPFLSVL